MKIEFEWNDLVDLVDEASSDDINRIAHAISDIINVVNSNDGENIDLSDYYTKEETDEKDQQIIDKVDYNSSDIQSIFSAIGAIGNDISKKEDVTNKVTVIDGLSPNKDKEYPSVWAVWNAVTDCENSAISYTDNAIGNIESALENIIAKYGLGGDAS